MEIIIDQTSLRQISQEVKDEEKTSIISTLESEFNPDKAVGLSAPQLGIFKRAFIAKINNEVKVFVNPELSFPDNLQIPSIEGCLSLPGIARCVKRFNHIVVNGIDYYGKNACVIQHEYDHINGVLLLDHEETKSNEDILKEKNKERKDRINKKRQQKVTNKKSIKLSSKTLARINDNLEKYQKRAAKKDWIKQNYIRSILEKSNPQ